ncbi:hypothetical protein PINS_up024004 [Pythium insidiosum]|nr:hypothetical protein PINS_up024004 [Pythium insidiosum]
MHRRSSHPLSLSSVTATYTFVLFVSSYECGSVIAFLVLPYPSTSSSSSCPGRLKRSVCGAGSSHCRDTSGSSTDVAVQMYMPFWSVSTTRDPFTSRTNVSAAEKISPLAI